MHIGPQEDPIIVEPAEDPFERIRTEVPATKPAPQKQPESVPAT